MNYSMETNASLKIAHQKLTKCVQIKNEGQSLWEI